MKHGYNIHNQRYVWGFNFIKTWCGLEMDKSEATSHVKKIRCKECRKKRYEYLKDKK